MINGNTEKDRDRERAEVDPAEVVAGLKVHFIQLKLWTQSSNPTCLSLASLDAPLGACKSVVNVAQKANCVTAAKMKTNYEKRLGGGGQKQEQAWVLAWVRARNGNKLVA